MPLALDHITALTRELGHEVEKLTPDDDGPRMRMIQAAWQLAQALERPQDTLMRTLLLDSTTKAVIQVALDLKLFQALSTEPVASVELAEKTGSEHSLLVRLLNHLSATGFIEQAGQGRFCASELSQSLTTEKMQDSYTVYGQVFCKYLQVLPQYLADRKYRNPTDGLDCPMQAAFDTKLHAFQYIKTDPKLARAFKNAILDNDFTRRAYWGEPEFYPVQERLISGLRDDGAVIVDVGGGIGLDCEDHSALPRPLDAPHELTDRRNEVLRFHNEYPEPARARLVLQDAEHVLDTADTLPSRIEKMPHDFFEAQPVKGARAYYLHRILHDWSDEKARGILSALKAAMIPGYSKVLVHEVVIPAEGATWLSTTSDLIMMCGLAGRERSEQDFRDLFESVGMKMTGLWTRAPAEESIVEAIVPE